MPIPDFQSLMLPILTLYGDKREHGSLDILNDLRSQLKLTDEEKNELLPSGKQYRFNNRFGWATVYLLKAGLLNRPSRGTYIITPRGLEVLKEKPEKINMKYLEKFQEYVDFKNFKGEGRVDETTPLGTDRISTPQESLESSYLELRRQISHDLLERVKQSSPSFFERLVVDLLLKMGYGGSRIDAGQAIGRTGDDGIDGVIKEDKLGLDVVHIQAKRWQNVVSRPEIQAFVGSLEGQRSRKGVFITTSKFTAEAQEYVKRIEKKIVLIDGEQLTQLMIDNGVGVAEESRYIVNRIDEDYFIED
jgi:restriction system protein